MRFGEVMFEYHEMWWLYGIGVSTGMCLQYILKAGLDYIRNRSGQKDR
jgi:hypothetical protein